MNYGKINTCDIANGPGVRVSLFVSGCRNHCKGCFNPKTWDFGYGQPFTDETMNYILEALGRKYIDGFTILGGDPFEPENQDVVVDILRKIRKVYPYINIWMYTGYLYDVDLVKGGKVWTEVTDEIFGYIDTLVDGPFIESEKDITLQYRGSRNQRVITFDADEEK